MQVAHSDLFGVGSQNQIDVIGARQVAKASDAWDGRREIQAARSPASW
jgi:hypothetical protein